MELPRFLKKCASSIVHAVFSPSLAKNDCLHKRTFAILCAFYGKIDKIVEKSTFFCAVFLPGDGAARLSDILNLHIFALADSGRADACQFSPRSSVFLHSA